MYYNEGLTNGEDGFTFKNKFSFTLSFSSTFNGFNYKVSFVSSISADPFLGLFSSVLNLVY